jgi:hypothetical protein
MKDKKLLNIPVIPLNSALKMLGKSMLFFVLLIAVASCSGDVGLDGPEGPVGPQGIPGGQGKIGVSGEDGVDGSTGPQGIAGSAGEDGVDGSAGPQGNDGSAGEDGVDGSAGEDGDNGFAVYRAAPANTAITTLDSDGDVGSYTSITIGADGLPIISYYDTTNDDLKVARCSNALCAPYFRRR